MIEDLTALTKAYWHLNTTMAPTGLLSPVRTHAALLARLVEAGPPPSLAKPLAKIAGDTYMLSGWLAFLLEDRRNARHLWTHADQLAAEFGDERLHAHVLIARSSLVSGLPYGRRGGDSGLVLSMLNEAAERSRGDPFLNVWLKSRRAEEHGAAGNSCESARDLLAAERDLAGVGDQDDDRLLPGPRTPVDLAGYAGNCAVLLGHDRQASDVLQRAAEEAPRSRATFRAVLLNDLGAALARLGELERSCAAFMESLDLAGETGASVHVQRVAGASRSLSRWQSSPQVQELEHRLREIA